MMTIIIQKIIIVVGERLVSDNNEMEEVVWQAWPTLGPALSYKSNILLTLHCISNTLLSDQPALLSRSGSILGKNHSL